MSYFISFLGCIFVIWPPDLILVSRAARVLRVAGYCSRGRGFVGFSFLALVRVTVHAWYYSRRTPFLFSASNSNFVFCF